MGEFGEGEVPPEKLAEIINVVPFGMTAQEVQKNFDEGRTIRWSYNRNKFDLTVWSFIPTQKEHVEHYDVDPKAKKDGTTGYYNQENGTVFAIGYLAPLTKNEKDALKICLKKYFNK